MLHTCIYFWKIGLPVRNLLSIDFSIEEEIVLNILIIEYKLNDGLTCTLAAV